MVEKRALGSRVAILAVSLLLALPLAASGLRHGASPADSPLPILEGADWKYFKGTVEPPAAWSSVGFDDASWPSGPSGFGYGDGDDATLLSDMQNGYLSVYTRRQFDVPDPGAVAGLELTVDWDDGFVAFVNGQEVARRNLAGATGTPVSHDIAASTHEAGTPETIAVPGTMLVAGANVIAVQGHNRGLDSTDLSLIVELRAQNPPPSVPTSASPADGATGVPVNPNLCVSVSDPNDANLSVTFHGREVTVPAADPFTIVALPDTQYYSESHPGTYTAQTQWIVDNLAGRAIAFVTELGDCVNVGATEAQWINADAAWDRVEDPLATGLQHGVPYGIAVGNHDQNPIGDPGTLAAEGSTTPLYNAYFGVPRFAGRSYYGGHYGGNNDNHYELFQAGGMDFIAIHMEYMPTDTPLRQAVLAWADGVLAAFPGRRAILTAHYFVNPGDASWSSQGSATWEALKHHHNLFLMLSGHLDQANDRYDEYTDGSGTTRTHALVSDYQTRPGGGNGWLRILTFHPDSDRIDVETYSPTLGVFIDGHADNTAGTAKNRLSFTYDMAGGAPFAPVGSASGQSGSQVCAPWPGRQGGTTYEWYAVVSDGVSSTAGAPRSFTTGQSTCTLPSQCDDGSACTTDDCVGGTCQSSPIAGCCASAAECADGDGCTDDLCVEGTCQNPDNTAPCDDGDGCTAGDVCASGVCAGLPSGCDDGNACTADACLGGACVHPYAPTTGCCLTSDDCDDGALCSADSCQSGSCVNVASANCCDTDQQCDDGEACSGDLCLPTNTASLLLNGTTAYVTMGTAPELGATQFTVEAWFKRTGTGVANTTGSAGIAGLVPLVAKGAPEADGSNVDANYVLGINTAGNVLAADFEDTATGLNHPVSGTTPIASDTWYHAAATYDGSTWRLYLDGDVEATLAVGAFTPRSDSIQPLGLGTMQKSALAPGQLGFFAGALDEVRIWSVVRSAAEIQAGMTAQIDSAPGLLGRWALNEGSGTAAADSAGTAQNGTLAGGAAWGAGVPAISSGTCTHQPVAGCCHDNTECDDGSPCTTDACEGASCEHVAIPGCCVTPADCDDGNPCTSEACLDGACVLGEPNPDCCAVDADCDDGDACTADSCPVVDPDQGPGGQAALFFDGVDDSVTMGQAAGVASVQFTVEAWFRRTGPGIANSTGASGIASLVPLVAKGAPEADGSNVDANFILGIDTAGNALAADFEDSATGLNHPVSGTTALLDGSWYHAAATYDGTTWRLYLNGDLEATLVVGAFSPRADSIQPLGLATMQKSAGAAAPLRLGFFAGLLDEVRVWNVARTQPEIRASLHREILSAPGLTGRWGLNEGSGALAHDATGGADGALAGPPAWSLEPGDPLGLGTPAVCRHEPIADCCTADPECGDGDPCTTDTCTPSGCAHDPIAGCCQTPADCDDADACTTDACAGNVCTHAANASLCDDGDACTADACLGSPTPFAVAFDGVNDFVTFGTAAELGLPRFTLETWFKRTGPGVGNTTGTGGIASLVPLIAKGAPEAEGSSIDANYLLGINAAGNALAADFEDAATGLNHPVSGTTPIASDVWYHAAATYDGTTWRLYLNGTLEATLLVGAFTPRADSIQPAGLGTMQRSAQTPLQVGFFQGVLDEARIWSYPRSQTEIQNARLRPLAVAPGLVARWGMDEGSGGSLADSSAPAASGTLTNFTLPGAWVAGAPALQATECGSSDIAGCCTSAGQCDDGLPCTQDTCDANVCASTPIPGCTSCTADAQCDDGSPCTADTCNTANGAAVDLTAATGDVLDLGQSAAAGNFINNFGTSSFTVEAWFYARSVGADLTGIFRAGQQGTAPQVALQLRTGTTPWIATSVERSVGGAGTAQVDAPAVYAAAAAVTLNAWHHVALVLDRAGAQLRTYLDGALVGTVALAWNAADPVNMPAGQTTLLGAARSSTPALVNYLDGYVDEVRIWSRARTQAEIQGDRVREIVAATGLEHRWGFDETGGSAIDDPGSFDGSFVGAAARTTALRPVFGDDLCVSVASNEGSACDDGDGCTAGDACATGACTGTPISVPEETPNLRATDKTSYAWDPVPGAAVFQVLRGSLGSLPVGPGGGDEVCFDQLAAATVLDLSEPPADTGYWYLSRAGNACGAGTYGARSNGAPRSSTSCP